MWAINQGSASVLFSAQVVNQADWVIYIIHINAWVGIRANKRREIHEISQQHK